MKGGKQRALLFFCLGAFIFLVFVNLMVLYGPFNKITTKASSEASVEIEIIRKIYCDNGVCDGDEDCSSCEADCGACAAVSSGGGGGGSVSLPDEISIDEDSFNVNIVLEESKTREFKIKNMGSKAINVDVTVEGLENFIIVDNNLLLEPSEERTVEFDIISPNESGIYTGKIVLRSARTKKEILIVVNTQSKETLFDLSVAVLEEKLEETNNLRAQLTLIPVGEKGVDVSVKYLIKDFRGKVYYESSETFYVENQMSFVKEFDTRDLNIGDYVLGIEMTYIGGFATASSQFKIVDDKFLSGIKLKNQTIFIIAIGLILFLIVIITVSRKQTYKKYLEVIHNKRK